MEELTPEEQELLQEAAKSYGSPQAEEKYNFHTFLTKVFNATDTTKAGNLNEEETGFTPYSLRTYKKLALDCANLCNDQDWSDYFVSSGEILPATSLSKNAKLITLASTQKKEIADLTDRTEKKKNKGMFGYKENPAM